MLLAARVYCKDVTCKRRDANKRDVLYPGPIRISRLQFEFAELVDQILHRQSLTGRARGSSLEFVRSQPLNASHQRSRRDPRGHHIRQFIPWLWVCAAGRECK